MFKIAVVCGGPSAERGISLNSARSVLDHLCSSSIDILPFYVDQNQTFYAISKGQLYSNTPSDFDFKLNESAQALTNEQLEQMLKSVDLVFPVIHGVFGDDGKLQALLESLNVPYVGSSSASCQKMYCKYTSKRFLKKHGFATLPSTLLSADLDCLALIQDFFNTYQLQRAVIKPIFGGSSLGVYSVESTEEAFEKCSLLFKQGHEHVLLEPFCQGKEFTVVVFENKEGKPVALVPTSIEMSYDNSQIFDYRRKYLPTNQAVYHTPALFSDPIIADIRTQAQQLFNLFEMRDFVRLDGWLIDDQIYFTDINPFSGLEQNSFLFRQASLIGLTHKNALHYVLQSACRRLQLSCPSLEQKSADTRRPVYVLLGGKNAERQVSLMSGTNVWLKLLSSSTYTSIPFFYDIEGNIWQLPYSYTLNHTVEEIYSNCLNSYQDVLNIEMLYATIQQKLGLPVTDIEKPKKLNLEEFLVQAQQERAFVFIAMHGGEGEDGSLQEKLEDYQIPYNGSNQAASKLCMDKYLTGQTISQLNHPSICSVPKKSLYLPHVAIDEIPLVWHQLTQELKSSRFIVKPRADGCSAGIVILQNEKDLEKYVCLLQEGCTSIPIGTFPNQKGVVEMPPMLSESIIEPYIEVDRIVCSGYSLEHFVKEGWIELTVGVLEEEGMYYALSPSITVAEGAVLSLEEKFQGGTGINLTPPPEKILSIKATQLIKKGVEEVARALMIQNYARIDIFFNCLSEQIIVIEANTLPALTASTVLYHQALAENPPIYPLALLEKIISAKLNASQLVPC